MASSSEPSPSLIEVVEGAHEDVLGTSECLWRVCRRPHADLTGIGATYASGRWHTRHQDRRVLYCAADPSTAILEVVIRYLDELAEGLPADLVLVRIDVDHERLAGVRRDRVIDLAADWPGHVRRTRACGDAWLTAGEGLALTVPSALSPAPARNVVVNAAHGAVSELLHVAVIDPLADKIRAALAGVRMARTGPRAAGPPARPRTGHVGRPQRGRR
jgi:RES domain-containing protein